jgi:hypothetical protein
LDLCYHLEAENGNSFKPQTHIDLCFKQIKTF